MNTPTTHTEKKPNRAAIIRAAVELELDNMLRTNAKIELKMADLKKQIVQHFVDRQNFPQRILESSIGIWNARLHVDFYEDLDDHELELYGQMKSLEKEKEIIDEKHIKRYVTARLSKPKPDLRDEVSQLKKDPEFVAFVDAIFGNTKQLAASDAETTEV